MNLIIAIYGDFGGRGSNFCPQIHGHDVWPISVKSMNVTHERGLVLHSYLRKNVGNGRSTRFWSHVWIGHLPLKDRFLRLFHLETTKDCLVCDNGMASGFGLG